MGKIAAIFRFNKRGAMPLTQEERIMTLSPICKRWRSAALLPLFLTRMPEDYHHREGAAVRTGHSDRRYVKGRGSNQHAKSDWMEMEKHVGSPLLRL